MRITPFGRHLIQLTRLPRIFPMNAYFVREDDGLTLIDTGMAGGAPGILQAAAQFGAPIRRIVLTHAHMDHVGSLDALHAAVPQAEVLISARDARMLRGDMSLDMAEQGTQLRGSYQTARTSPTRLLGDGDSVGSLHVIATPGHTPGHLALFDPREGDLIAGDAFQTQGGLAVSGVMRWRFPFPAMGTWSRAAALDSARRLRALSPGRLAVGHGAVLEQPAALMDAVIAAAARHTTEAVTHGA